MNDPIDDGGPAFPFVMPDPFTHHTEQGMALRDYFAAAAMAAFISNESRVAAMAHASDGQEGIVDFAIALSAYGMADAMLAARKEKL